MHPNTVQLLSVTMTASNGLRQSPENKATPMHFHAEDEIFHILEGTVTFSIDGDVFNASVGSIVVIPAGAHHAWRNRSNSPIRMSTFFSPGGVEELYPKLVGLSLEELSTVVEPFGSGIVGPPIDE
jgi:mannose-6-phosphate isomerase-like protein (cupin superfamily)